MNAGFLARQAGIPHRPYRFQGRLAGAVAAEPGRRSDGYALRRQRSPACSRWREVGKGMRSIIADIRDLRRLASVRCLPPGRRSSSTWPRSRWCAVPIRTRSKPMRPMSWAPCICWKPCANAGRQGGRQRHHRQVLRKPRVGLGLSGKRADGRARSLQQQQGLRRTGDRRLSLVLFQRG